MDRAGRFLWLPWLRGRIRARDRSTGGHLAYWEGEHDGYTRLADPASHRRGLLRLGPEHWLVLDDLTGRRSHEYRLHWLLVDSPFDSMPGPSGSSTIGLRTPVGPYEIRLGSMSGGGTASLVRADPDGPRGWRSPTYLVREPALSLSLEEHATSVRFWTLLGPPVEAVAMPGDGLLLVRGPTWEAHLTFGPSGPGPLLADVRLAGHPRDHLAIGRP
jgi:hypothetical protein